MKAKDLLRGLLSITMMAMLSVSLTSCGDGDNEKSEQDSNVLLLGRWEHSISAEDDIYGDESYSFFEDGLGMYMKWKKKANGHSSDYQMPFSYTFTGSTLVLDYGFGYTRTYRVESLSHDFLNMYLSTKNIFCSRKDFSNEILHDYSADIVGTWSIDDTEKAQNYLISFRADGTYESQSTTSYSTITENGNYRVEYSRVKFSSTNNNSLLNGRIFLITWIGNPMNLQTENGTGITGKKYQRN